MTSFTRIWSTLALLALLTVLPDLSAAQVPPSAPEDSSTLSPPRLPPPTPPLTEVDLLRRQIQLQETFQGQLLTAVWGAIGGMGAVVGIISAIVVFAQFRLSNERVKAIEDNLRSLIQTEAAALDRRQAERIEAAIRALEDVLTERLTKSTSDTITKRLLPINSTVDRVYELQYSLLSLQVELNISHNNTEAALNHQRELLELLVERGESWRKHDLLQEIISNLKKPDGRILAMEKDLWHAHLKKLGPEYAGAKKTIVDLLDQKAVS